jgi:hypothetical protein
MSICSAAIGDLGPLVVKPKVAWKMLACSNTRGYELLKAGHWSPSKMESLARFWSLASRLTSSADSRNHAHDREGRHVRPQRTSIAGATADGLLA